MVFRVTMRVSGDNGTVTINKCIGAWEQNEGSVLKEPCWGLHDKVGQGLGHTPEVEEQSAIDHATVGLGRELLGLER